MLQVTEIREDKEQMITALAKRGFDATQILEDVTTADELRRTTQAKLDETLAQSNTFSREIGLLFKQGEKQKASLLKEKTAQLKEVSKELSEQLSEASNKLQQLLFTIPNIPNELVPAGTNEEDNEEVFKEGEIPVLGGNPMPHWELAKKYDIINFELGV
jgi:seryl-tRNA synthetase